MSRALLLCLAYFIGAHLMTWFQLNGQFIWSWFKDHPLTLCLFGIPVSYFYIVATKYSFEAFNQLLWPGRFVGFAIGMITFTVFLLGLATGMFATLLTYCIWVSCMWIINGKRGV